VRACYDPREAPELWERMGQIGGGERPPEWMSTHPASETRAENFRQWMPAAIAEYEARCGALR
jgi:metalloendopeptidase OMA1, mitochondrial